MASKKHPSSLENLVKDKVLECIESKGKPIYEIQFYEITTCSLGPSSGCSGPVMSESPLQIVIVQLEDADGPYRAPLTWSTVLSTKKITRSALDEILKNPEVKIKSREAMGYIAKLVIVKQVVHIGN